mgnify:CR=1 FL=1
MRVVIATDGSIEADLAETVFLKLPLPEDARFTVAMATHLPIHAAPAFTPEGLSYSDKVAADTWRIQHQVARRTAESVAARIRTRGFEAEARVLEGDTAEELLGFIKSENTDAVVVGFGVSSNLAAAFLGSVSRKLVLYSEASVLVGRHYSDVPVEGSCCRLSGKDRLDVLIAVDGSAGSELSVKSLECQHEKVFRSVTMIAVEPLLYSSEGMDPTLLYPSIALDRARIEAVARGAAERLVGCADRVEFVTAFGRPSVEIARTAESRGSDLIMLGANRHGFLDRLLLGSCAYEVATSAPCSVLILRDVLPFSFAARSDDGCGYG